MILGFELTLVLYVTLAGLFRLLWGLHQKTALWVLTISGGFILFALNGALFVYLVLQVLLVLALYKIGQRFPDHARQISWLAFLGLIPFNLQLWFGQVESLKSFVTVLQGPAVKPIVWTAGATFFVIKSFVSLREAIQERNFRVLPMLAGLTFVPAFPAGPIFGTQPFRPEKIADELDFKVLRLAFLQFGWGAAAFYILSPEVRGLATSHSGGVFGTTAEIYLGLLALFLDFSGYTLMALSIASMFGISLPQNFNRPYMATSIREFWQRWHMSLNWFVGTYLFKPFVRNTGSAQKGIFLSFLLVGLWHEVSIGYVLWGLGHGCALALAMKPPAVWRSFMSALPVWMPSWIGRFLTITWVALLSYIASGAVLGAR